MGGLSFKRGDLVTVVLPGNYGKPRPAVVVQSKIIDLDSVVVCPITSLIRTLSFRVILEPNFLNNLEKISQIMVDKISTIPKTKVTQIFGCIDDKDISKLDKALMLVLGIGDMYS